MKVRENLEKLKSRFEWAKLTNVFIFYDAVKFLNYRPRRRPDWSEMMKEVEEIRKNKKLRHVECNDR